MGSPQKFIELLELLGLGQYKFIRPDPNVRNLDFFFMWHSEQAVMVLIESAGSDEPGGPPNVALYGPACGPWYQKH